MAEVYERTFEELDQEHGADDQLDLLKAAMRFADELARRPNLGLQIAPLRELQHCAQLGLMTAPLPREEGGLGLGTDAGTQNTFLRVLAALGGGDLALGRIFEGHVNGLLLVQRYGTREQMARLAEEVRGGMISGVWNTGQPKLLQLIPEGEDYRFEGEKTFATGAAFVQRPIVTAEIAGRGWQMTIPRMEKLAASIDRSFWHPLGMESSESFGVTFTGGMVRRDELVGAAGDFYRDPMFRGGAVRFAAVQAGAVMRLHTLFAEWLDTMRRGDDPYQIARLGRVAIAAQEAAMWVEKAASVAEESLYRIDKAHTEHMVECANMMRLAIERLGTGVMQEVTVGIGAHGLLQPARFERIIRDLTMYLRQPAPDATLASVGRISLEKSHRRAGGSADGFWNEGFQEESLPPKYFERIYARKADPWSFTSSEYEKKKYEVTLAALPHERYRCALEVGCSIGVMTGLLAERCEALLALDVSEKPLETAREHCGNLAQVSFRCLRVPQQMPEGEFDLIIVSEVGYYWSMPDLELAATRLAQRQDEGGHLVLVHLTERVQDYPLTGDQVHDYWLGRPEWTRVSGSRHERFRIDVLERTNQDKL